jgi:hypothetical protein
MGGRAMDEENVGQQTVETLDEAIQALGGPKTGDRIVEEAIDRAISSCPWIRELGGDYLITYEWGYDDHPIERDELSGWVGECLKSDRPEGYFYDLGAFDGTAKASEAFCQSLIGYVEEGISESPWGENAAHYNINETLEEYLVPDALAEVTAELTQRGVSYDEDALRDSLKSSLEECISVDWNLDDLLDMEVPCDLIANTEVDWDDLGAVMELDRKGKPAPKLGDSALARLIESQGTSLDGILASVGGRGTEFERSMRIELDNNPYPASEPCFLVQAKLRDWATIMGCLAYGLPFEVSVNRNAVCGLFDRYNGSGSCMEVQLDRDVKLDQHYVADLKAEPSVSYDLGDRGEAVGIQYGCGVQDVYGLVGSAWDHGTLEVRTDATLDMSERWREQAMPSRDERVR